MQFSQLFHKTITVPASFSYLWSKEDSRKEKVSGSFYNVYPYCLCFFVKRRPILVKVMPAPN
jgi:hypothetical protein